MIVSHRHEFVFIHNPKCAGTSFRTHIEQYHDDTTTFWDITRDAYLGVALDYAHLRLWELQLCHGRLLERLRQYRSVVFVRNPFRRMLSALAQHIGAYRPEFDLDGQDWAGRQRAFRRVIDELTFERIMTDFRYVHFSPQHWFVALPGDDLPWTIVPISEEPQSILPGFDALGLPRMEPLRKNIALNPDASFLGDPRLRSFVRTFYAADFDLFERLGLPGWVYAEPVVAESMMA